MEVHKIRVDSDSTKQSDESFNLFYSKTTPKQKCTSLLLLKRTFLSFLNHFFFFAFFHLPSLFQELYTWKLAASDTSRSQSHVIPCSFATPWASMGCWKRRVNRVSPESVEDAKVEVGAAVPDRPPAVPVDRVKEIFLSARERQEEAW